MTYTAEQITKLMDKEKVKYIRIYFTDVLGTLKGMSITRSEIDEVLENGQGFDGSSIEGFARIEESDLSARPDLSTFRIFPWDIAGERVAMMFADVQTPTGEPYSGDPRQILRRVLKKAADMGYTAYIGPELEFFYFRQNGTPETIDSAGYFDYGTIDQGARVRKKTVVALESVGIQVECSHHEVAPSQHEIDLKYSDALKMADQAMIYRMIVKEVALENGIFASFMPKPLFGQNGSGMHCHQSLFKGSNNAFFSKTGEYHLVRHRTFIHRGSIEACEGVYSGDESVGELVQAPGAGLRSAGLHFLGTAQSFLAGAHSDVSLRQREGDARRVAFT